MDAAIVTSLAKSSKSCSSSRVHSRLHKWVSGSFVSNTLPLKKKNSLMQWRVTRGNFTGKQINLKYTERILRDRLPATICWQSVHLPAWWSSMSQDKHDLKFAEILKLWIHGQENSRIVIWPRIFGRWLDEEKPTKRPTGWNADRARMDLTSRDSEPSVATGLVLNCTLKGLHPAPHWHEHSF